VHADDTNDVTIHDLETSMDISTVQSKSDIHTWIYPWISISTATLAMAPFERAMVSYRLSIVTVALSVTIRPQFAIECLRRSNQQGVGHFGPKFPGVTLWSRPLLFGYTESEYPRLANGEIISEEFQPI